MRALNLVSNGYYLRYISLPFEKSKTNGNTAQSPRKVRMRQWQAAFGSKTGRHIFLARFVFYILGAVAAVNCIRIYRLDRCFLLKPTKASFYQLDRVCSSNYLDVRYSTVTYFVQGFFTNHTRLTYTLAGVIEPSGAKKNTLSRSMGYLNHPLETCVISLIQVELPKRHHHHHRHRLRCHSGKSKAAC